MAAVTGAALAAGATIYSANKQAGAAEDAAKASQNATNAALQYQQQNYNRAASNLNPYISAGTNALGGLNQIANGDYSGFENSPDYKFTLQQGMQGLDRSAAARGNLFSGGQQADILNYAQGLAGTQLNGYRNFLSGLAGMGQNAATSLGSIGSGQANASGNYLMGNAANQTNAGYNQANANSNMVSQLAGLGGQLAGQWGGVNNPTSSSYAPSALSTNTNYSGLGSLSTAWPGMAGGWGG